jgi:hypothetical protein
MGAAFVTVRAVPSRPFDGYVLLVKALVGG